jgi:hypothetical protein
MVDALRSTAAAESLSHKYDVKARMHALHAVRAWAAQGYQPIYLSGRQVTHLKRLLHCRSFQLCMVPARMTAGPACLSRMPAGPGLLAGVHAWWLMGCKTPLRCCCAGVLLQLDP